MVGVSTQASAVEQEGYLDAMLSYDGPLYLVNPKGGEIRGLKVYPSLMDIPGPVDYAILLTRAERIPQVMKDCVAKGVKVAYVLATGFSESDDAEAGRQLEAQIVDIARRGGLRVIGPNAMGIYCPSSGISFLDFYPREAGHIGHIAQSGGNASDLVEPGSHRGLRFSKVVSYGNACDLNECDFLAYLTCDTDTQIIAMYIEGIRDGRRFVEALSDATKAKPVIVFKGGRTEAGARATLSHTSSIAGDDAVWDSLCRQMGVIQAYNMEELIDILVTLSLLRPPRGRNVALVDIGGGRSVLAADECERAGLRIPHLHPEVSQELQGILPEVGSSPNNPIDRPYAARGWDGGNLFKTLKLISACDNIDLVLAHVRLRLGFTRESVAGEIDTFIKAHRQLSKPLAMALSSGGSIELSLIVHELQQELQWAGIPVYPTVGRAAYAINKLVSYREQRGRIG
jgi:acyl-CoA synthetase (NDP forming)